MLNISISRFKHSMNIRSNMFTGHLIQKFFINQTRLCRHFSGRNTGNGYKFLVLVE